MVFAGPVFPEWHWGSLFFLAILTPVILPVAVLINWRVRRLATVRGWAVTAPRRYAIVAGSLVASALLVAAGYTWWTARKFERDSRAEAARLTFQAYAPLRPPPGYATDSIEASGGELRFAYQGEGRYLWIRESAVGRRPVTTDDPKVVVRGDTLIMAEIAGDATESEAVALLDTLAPVDAETLDFQR